MRTLLLVAALLFAAPAAAQVSQATNAGFAKCVRSSNPALPNYFSESAECPIAGNHYWLLGTQAEKAFATSCDNGPNGQSVPINVGGPLTLTWEPSNGVNALRMRADFYSYRHPCVEGGQYTWFSLMDHLGSGGGPLPAADVLQVHFQGIYNEVIGDQKGKSRMGVSWYGTWGGKLMSVDVQLYTHAEWGDNHPDPDILVVTEAPGFLYVQLRGDKMPTAYVIPALGGGFDVDIDFGAVLKNLIARGILPAPAAGEAWTTQVVGPFIETTAPTRNRRSVVADLWMYLFQTSAGATPVCTCH